MRVHSTTEAEDNSAPATLSYTVIIFHSLNVFALILILVILSTAALTRDLRRIKMWYTFLCVQLFYVISFLLHPFKKLDYEPEFGLCLLQAMLVHAAPLAANWALLALIVEVYTLIRTNWTSQGKFKLVIFSTPVFIFAGVAIAVLVDGLKHPSSVGMTPESLYCHLISTGPYTTVMDAIIYLLPTVICFTLSFTIGFSVYRYSRDIERQSVLSGVSPSSVIRVAALLLGPIPALSCLLPRTYVQLQQTGHFLFLMPILTAIVFGTQRDMVAAMFPWSRSRM
ncbi:hypothetical protein BDN72DRAFT_845047 [Pluteus cervinus]|uniref:Uncharacterized protein n=1 Tax=Pluteus cervinus TaxID=181527 RepID=A0ACD3AJC4_9AGAR|nr:hypothetical protein BDN72DRAFT_845047 [Pluteus cervinus]